MILKGLIFVLLLVLGVFSGVVLMIPSVMLILVHSKRVIGWRRRYVSCISGVYFDCAAALIQILGGTKVYIYSNTAADVLISDKSALIICNHRSLVDWMFAGWCYASKFNLNSSLRIILKDSLRSVPLFGWAMQITMYIFLSRKREMDIPHIKRTLSYLLCTGATPSLFLFPEGTDLSESNKKKSNTYAQNKNLPTLEYVLYPKPSGLLCCLTTVVEKHESSFGPRLIKSDANKREMETDNVEERININSEERTTGYGEKIHLKNSLNNGLYGHSPLSVNDVNSTNKNMKEHKAESVMYVQEDIPYLRGNESKDGNNKLLKLRERKIESGKEREIGKNEEEESNVRRGDEQFFENVKKNKLQEKMKGEDNNNDNLKEELNENNSIRFLHDLTIAYKDFKKGKRTSDKSIILGEFPPEVHILVDRFAIKDIPLEKSAFEQWLRASFFRKEKLLKAFYEFDENESVDDLKNNNKEILNTFTNTLQTRNWPKKLHLKASSYRPIFQVCTWIIGVFSCLYFFIWYRWFVVVMIISCIAVRAFNGFDSVELSLHSDMILRELFCKNGPSNSNCSSNDNNDDDDDDDDLKINNINNQIDNDNNIYNNNSNNNINSKESDNLCKSSVDTPRKKMVTERGKQKDKFQ